MMLAGMDRKGDPQIFAWETGEDYCPAFAEASLPEPWDAPA